MMTNEYLRRLFQQQTAKINRAPKKYLEERRKHGNIFATGWVDKGETERRAKK